jgi:hypothetical protein
MLAVAVVVPDLAVVGGGLRGEKLADRLEEIGDRRIVTLDAAFELGESGGKIPMRGQQFA